MKYQAFCSTEIEFLSKDEMELELMDVSNKNLVVLLSNAAAKRWDMQDVLNKLMLQNNTMWIDKIKPNPAPKDICELLEEIKLPEIDLIIAIGGGSSIDLAKGISAFYKLRHKKCTTADILDKIKSKSYQTHNEYIDILAIPTTAGTGSELTQWATIWDKDNSTKYSIDHPNLKPKRTIIVPELTMSLNKDMTLTSGLDALCHAVEAYWSIHTNILVQDLAFRSIEIILDTMKQVLNEPANYSLRERMCRASVLAGMAFSKTRTTACHSISYPLTMIYGIPHGYAVAMTLDEVSKRNKGYFSNDTVLFKLFEYYGGIKKWLDGVCDGIIQPHLSYFDIQKSDIKLIVKNAFTSGRMDNNPVHLGEEDVREILLCIM